MINQNEKSKDSWFNTKILSYKKLEQINDTKLQIVTIPNCQLHMSFTFFFSLVTKKRFRMVIYQTTYRCANICSISAAFIVFLTTLAVFHYEIFFQPQQLPWKRQKEVVKQFDKEPAFS